MLKLKIFRWQLCYVSLPTKEILFKRAMNIDPLCPFCQSEIEDADNLFLHCQITQEFWRLAISHNWIENGILQRLSMARIATSAVKMDRVAVLLWSMRKIRNNMVFHKETPIPGSTLIRAKKLALNGVLDINSHKHYIYQPQASQTVTVRRLIG